MGVPLDPLSGFGENELVAVGLDLSRFFGVIEGLRVELGEGVLELFLGGLRDGAVEAGVARASVAYFGKVLERAVELLFSRHSTPRWSEPA